MKRKADWVAWVLQFAFGFLVGSLLTMLIGQSLGNLRTMIAEGQRPNICIGVGLIMAALATRYGERMWMYNNNTFKMTPPDKPRSSRVSRIMSVLAGLSGFGAVLFALFGK